MCEKFHDFTDPVLKTENFIKEQEKSPTFSVFTKYLDCNQNFRDLFLTLVKHFFLTFLDNLEPRYSVFSISSAGNIQYNNPSIFSSRSNNHQKAFIYNRKAHFTSITYKPEIPEPSLSLTIKLPMNTALKYKLFKYF